jgi:hypothetical protein
MPSNIPRDTAPTALVTSPLFLRFFPCAQGKTVLHLHLRPVRDSLLCLAQEERQTLFPATLKEEVPCSLPELRTKSRVSA